VLLNDGTESLVTAARRWAGDPSTAANPMFDTEDDVIPSINVAYLDLMDQLRVPGTGWTRKMTYLDGQAFSGPDDFFYPLPGDFVGRLRVEISSNGSDLSLATAGSNAVVVLEPAAYDKSLDYYYVGSGGTSDVRYAFIFGRTFGISTPLTAAEAGTRSIRLTYEASTPQLVEDSDEPDLPRPHHDLIAMGAALRLLVGEGLPIGDLERRYEIGVVRLRRSAWEQMADYDGQIAVAGRRPTARSTNVGRMYRRAR
jgi:hypothetical protein